MQTPSSSPELTVCFPICLISSKMLSTFTLSSAISLAALAAGSSSIQNSSGPNFHAPPPANLTLLANGSLFYQWRPQARFIFPSDQLSDPTGLWQDANGTFRISALHSNFRAPNVSISSGIAGATTKDFLTYTDYHNYTNSVEIGPGNKNDPMAVFDGSVIPKGYKGLPTLIYTGAHYAPIYWADFYITGAETQNLAYSEDNGATWIKPAIPPLIPQAPNGYNVTGFRDAWAFQFPQIASILGDDAETWYMTLSSGIHGVGPRLFLYRCNGSDFLDWEYLGPSVVAVVNTTYSVGGFSGNDGSNYEVANTLALDQNGVNLTHGANFVTMGAESGRTSHSSHYSLWKMGAFVKDNDTGVILEDHATGVLDWGVGYACTTVLDNLTDRRIAFCWNNEDFNSTNSARYQIGAAGALSVPRELFFKEIPNVVADDLAAESGYWSVITDGLKTVKASTGVSMAKANRSGTVDLAVLGCKPAAEVLDFRQSASHSWNESSITLSLDTLNTTGVDITRSGNVTEAFVPFVTSPRSRHWEMKAIISIPSSSLRELAYEDFAAGITVLRSNPSQPADWPTEKSSIYYRPSNESFIVSRDMALSRDNINTDPEVGKLRLWQTISDRNESLFQALHIRAFLDGSFFEVYVNDVLTISTRIYYWYADSTDMGFYLQFPSNWQSSNNATAATRDTEVTFSNVQVWEGVPNIFPLRPTSSELLIQNNTGFVQPPDNPNLPLFYDGVGAPPLPPNSAIPAGLSDAQIAEID